VEGLVGGMAQVLKHLPTKDGVLNSNTSISKKRKEEQIAQIWIMTGRQLRLDSTDLCLGLFTLGVSAPISCIMVGQEMFPFFSPFSHTLILLY
jgi:hypothetical protein